MTDLKIVNKIKRGISLLYLACQALIPPTKVHSSNKVLLVEMGHIGDTIVEAPVWQSIIDWAFSQGKEVYIFATQEAWSILTRVLKTEKIHYIECEKHLHSFDECRRSLSLLRSEGFDTVIARPYGNMRLFPLVAALPSVNRYIIVQSECVTRLVDSVIFHMFTKRYTKVIVDELGSCERETLEKLLNELGIDNYGLSILPIAKCHVACPGTNEYITVAVDSQNTARRWPTDRFVALIKELLKTYDEDIILTGSFLNEKDTKRYREAFYENGRVKNMIGKCSFDQWIELLRGACFHIGVDSGSIHVAASVGTTAFCLTGVWHEHRFFPYSTKENLPGTTAPICVYRQDADVEKIPCYGCAARKRYGLGNRECTKKCHAGSPCECLEKITVDDVMDAIRDAKSRGLI